MIQLQCDVIVVQIDGYIVESIIEVSREETPEQESLTFSQGRQLSKANLISFRARELFGLVCFDLYLA